MTPNDSNAIPVFIPKKFTKEDHTPQTPFRQEPTHPNGFNQNPKISFEEHTHALLPKVLHPTPQNQPTPTNTTNPQVEALANKVEHLEQLIAQLLEQHQPNEDLATQLRTNNLYLAKLERKYEQIQHQLQSPTPAEENPELLNHLRTNNLFMAKLERKFDLILNQSTNSNEPNTNLTEMLNLLRTNNLFLGKLERKIEEVLAIQKQQFATTTPPSNQQPDKTQLAEQINAVIQKFDELTLIEQNNEALLTNVKSNSLHLSRLEHKIREMMNYLKNY